MREDRRGFLLRARGLQPLSQNFLCVDRFNSPNQARGGKKQSQKSQLFRKAIYPVKAFQRFFNRVKSGIPYLLVEIKSHHTYSQMPGDLRRIRPPVFSGVSRCLKLSWHFSASDRSSTTTFTAFHACKTHLCCCCPQMCE